MYHDTKINNLQKFFDYDKQQILKQEKLERQAEYDAKKEHKDTIKKQTQSYVLGSTAVGRKSYAPFIETMHELLEAYVQEQSTKSRKSHLCDVLLEANHEVIIKTTLNSLVSNLTRSHNSVDVSRKNYMAHKIGAAIDGERLDQALFDASRKDYKMIKTEKDKRKAYAKLKSEFGVEPWPDNKRATIGGNLLHIVSNAGVIYFVDEKVRGSKYPVTVVKLKSDVLHSLTKLIEDGYIKPKLRPMVIKPLPWTNDRKSYAQKLVTA